MFKMIAASATLALALAASGALAQSGPVGAACKDDIAKLCAGKAHDGEVRACLTANKDKVVEACKTALDNTGPGKGKGQGKGKN